MDIMKIARERSAKYMEQQLEKAVVEMRTGKKHKGPSALSKEKSREYYLQHQEELKRRRRENYERKKEELKAYQREYYKNHKDQAKASVARWRQKKKEAIPTTPVLEAK